MNAVNKIVLIIPYFGRKPSYYELWEHTVLKNNSIDFLVITDIQEILEKKNLRVIHMSFEDFREKVQEHFDFPVKLDRPYKCCDYRPAYGLIFHELIKQYDFWGHCDLDLIFGNIRYFLTDECLAKNDKIFEYGHFCLYRNCEKMNHLFMEEGVYPELNYRECFQTDDVYAFDEFPGMLLKCRRLGVKVYADTKAFLDAKVDSKGLIDAFDPNAGKKIVVQYEEGKLYACELSCDDLKQKNYSALREREIMYFHFQKRNLKGVGFFDQKQKGFFIASDRLLPETAKWSELFNVRGEKIYRLRGRILLYRKKLRDHKNRFLSQKREGEILGIKDYIQQRRRLKQRFRASRQLVENEEWNGVEKSVREFVETE